MIPIMKDAKDLDPFAEQQIEMTRIIDAGGSEKSLRLVTFAIQTQQRAETILLHAGVSMHEWQRAAYELAHIAEADPSASNKLMAGALWRMVRYLQDSLIASREVAKDPEMIAALNARGIKVPDYSDD